MADDAAFEAWLAQLRQSAARARQPIAYYETRFGRAELRVDPNDPSQASYEGDDFSVSIDEDPDARPVRRSAEDIAAARARTEAAPAMRTEEDRSAGRRFQDALVFNDAYVRRAYSSIEGFFRGPTLGDRFLYGPGGLLHREGSEASAEAENRAAYWAWRNEILADTYDRELELQVTDAPESLQDWAADLGGGFLAYLDDPVNYLFPGRSILSRAAWQAPIQGGQNVAVQLGDRADGIRDAWSSADQAEVGRELARIYREEGEAAFDQALGAFDWNEADRLRGESAPFSPLETAFVATAAAVLSGTIETGFSAGARALGWRPRVLDDSGVWREEAPPGVIERVLDRTITAPYLRAAARRQTASFGDPVLDSLLRLPNGDIDPRAVPVTQAFATTEPWLRQLAPAVERAGLATSGRERAAAYAEALVLLDEAQQFGRDPALFARALNKAREQGGLPDLKAFRTLEAIANEMAQGRLVIDDLANVGRRLTRLAEQIDPAIAGLRKRRRVVSAAVAEADAALTARRETEGVREHLETRRTVSDEERADIDAYAREVATFRAQKHGLSLASWVIRRGGLRDPGGDLGHAIGGHTARPGLVNREGGRHADDMALAAWEEGYFPEFGDRPSIDELVHALAEEVNRGNARYARRDADAVEANIRYRQLEQWLERNGVDLSSRDEADLRRQIADKIYDATYAERVEGPDPADDAPAGGSANTGGAGASPGGGRAPPQGWGARRGQAAGMGAGGAAVSPQAAMKQHRTPIPRQTFWRRQARNVRRRGPATYVSDVISRAYTAIIEAQHPLVMAQKALIAEIEQLAGARVDVAASENAALLARLSRDGYSAGHLDLTDGVRPYRQPGVKASPGLREAVETATGGREWSDARIGDFEDYLIARRAVKAWDRYAAGELERPPHAMSKLDLEQAIQAFEADNPTFRDGADKLYRFLEAHWQKKRDAGLISDEQYAQGLARNEDYVPFQRDMDDSGADPSRGVERGDAPSTTGGRANKRRAFQRFRGSDRKIVSPLSTIMADVYATADRIARNETYRAFVDLASRAGDMGETIARRLKDPLRRTTIDVADEAERAARAAGASVQDAQALRGSIDALLNGDTSRVIYRAGDVVEGGRKIIYVWRNGEREAWELTDPEFADDLFKAMTGLTQEGRDLFLDVLAVPTQALRTAITAWPGFQAANLVRDSLSAWMVTDVGFVPGESLTHGAGQVLRQGDLAKLYNAVGTQGGGVVRASLPRSRVQRDLPALRGRVLRMRNLDPREGLTTIWRGFETATELSENATRIRLFARAYEKARRAGSSDYDAALWAAYESRDYLDFQRSGSKMLNARRVVLFLNAALQGLDRTLRTMTAEGEPRLMLQPLVNLWQGRTRWADMTANERYLVTRAWKYWTKLGLVGMFGLMLTALNLSGDEEADNDYLNGFSDYMKNNYWLVRAGNYWISIPKPFEHAVVSNILERSYEGTYGGDPLAWERLVKGLGETYLPPTEVTAAVVPMQLMMNKTATGAPIVPEGLEDLDPHLQYTANTSAVAVGFARGLSEHAGIEVSPAQLDHVFGGVAGEFYRAPAKLLNPDAMALNPPDMPVINRFVREPGRGGTPVRVHFYDGVMRQSGALNRAAGTLREHMERGDTAAAERFLAEREPWERDYAVLQVGFDTDARRLHPMNRARNVVTEIGRIRRELHGGRPLASETLFLPELTPRQRRDALEALDDVSAAEMQAALVMAGAPGWEGRPMADVEARYERLRAIAPGVAALLRARLVSGTNKAIDFDSMREVWPEAQRRLEAQGFRAELSDLEARGRADFGDAVIRALELEGQGGRREERSARERRRQDELEQIGAPAPY